MEVRSEPAEQYASSHISMNSNGTSYVDDVNNYVEILAELESVGRRISEAKRDLLERRRERDAFDRNSDPEAECSRVQAHIDRQNQSIADLSRRRNYLLDVTRRNAEEIERERAVGDSSVELMDLSNQIALAREELVLADRELNACSTYYRFVTSQIAQSSRHAYYPRNNEYGLCVSEPDSVEMENAIE